MIKVGIMGVGGYAGQALLSLLLNHQTQLHYYFVQINLQKLKGI